MFISPKLVDDIIVQIAQAAGSHSFAVIAYCFMPDHLHLLVEGTSEDSDLLAFVHAVKQRTAFRYRQEHDDTLWQRGYYEHVVRDEEATLEIARYILANSVPEGLVAEPREYPFSGSLVFDRKQLGELWNEGTATRGTP